MCEVDWDAGLPNCFNALHTATTAVRQQCMAFIYPATDERVAYLYVSCIIVVTVTVFDRLSGVWCMCA